ncbi:hypothetical protein VZO05_10820 [Aggregatilineales bacterium SYSU G02658]
MNWFNYGVFAAFFVIDCVDGKATVFTKHAKWVVYVDALRASGSRVLTVAVDHKGGLYVIDGDEIFECWLVPIKR